MKILLDPYTIKGTYLVFKTRKPDREDLGITNTMSTQKKRPQAGTKKQTGRKLGNQTPRFIKSAPNPQRITLGAFCKAYLVDPDGHFPGELEELFRKVEETALNTGKEAGMRELQMNQQSVKRVISPEEAAANILGMIRNYNGAQVNTIMAYVLQEISTCRETRLADIQTSMDKLRNEMGQAMAESEGFKNVRNGDFERLKLS